MAVPMVIAVAASLIHIKDKAYNRSRPRLHEEKGDGCAGGQQIKTRSSPHGWAVLSSLCCQPVVFSATLFLGCAAVADSGGMCFHVVVVAVVIPVEESPSQQQCLPVDPTQLNTLETPPLLALSDLTCVAAQPLR